MGNSVSLLLLDLKSNKIFDQRWRNISPAFPNHNHISNSRLQPIRSSPVSLNIIIAPEVHFTYFSLPINFFFLDLRVSGMCLCSPRPGWRRHSDPRHLSTAPSPAWAGTMTSLPGDTLWCCLSSLLLSLSPGSSVAWWPSLPGITSHSCITRTQPRAARAAPPASSPWPWPGGQNWTLE